MKTTVTALFAFFLFVAPSHAQESVTPTPAEDNSAIPATQPAQSSPLPQQGNSQVRIVRLSQVRGRVLLDRKTDRGFEAAFANLPIAQGQILQTGDGVAEVEFEDNSSLRVTPHSLIEFPALQRNASGATITTVKLLKGTLYVSLEKDKGNQFTVTLGNSTLTPTPSTHMRLDAGAGASTSKLAVFSGSVQVADMSGTTTVDKKRTLTFQDATPAPPVLTSKVEAEPFDQWDKNEVGYHQVSALSAYGNPSYTYGISDLNYYGSFVNAGGCGSMWRPYFASAAWDPYANGIWALYPGAGYTWVSPYPWGWTPFHYGSWNYCPTGGGWGWVPGGAWTGLANQPAQLNPTQCPHCPKAPLRPAAGRPDSLVSYNARPLAISRETTEGNFIFRKDSAGLGIPRESFGKLNKLSTGVERHGFISTPVFNPADRNPGQRENGPTSNQRSATPQSRANNASSTSHDAGRSSGWSGGSGGSAPAPSAPATSSGGNSSSGSHR